MAEIRRSSNGNPILGPNGKPLLGANSVPEASNENTTENAVALRPKRLDMVRPEERYYVIMGLDEQSFQRGMTQQSTNFMRRALTQVFSQSVDADEVEECLQRLDRGDIMLGPFFMDVADTKAQTVANGHLEFRRFYRGRPEYQFGLHIEVSVPAL